MGINPSKSAYFIPFPLTVLGLYLHLNKGLFYIMPLFSYNSMKASRLKKIDVTEMAKPLKNFPHGK